MAFKKGQSGNPNGRPNGAQSKSTQLAREAIAKFVDGNANRLAKWLDDIAADSPKDAFNAFMSVVEYHIPKLARTDHQQLDKDGKPADSTVKVTFVSGNRDT